VSTTLANFLFETANFLILAVALSWLLFKPIRRALDAEQERYKRTAEESQRLRAEAESLASKARAAQIAVQKETAEHKRQLLAAAEEEAARIRDEARKTESAERIARARELEISRNEEAVALADTVGRIAATSVSSLLESLEGPSLDAALVRAACKELASVPTVAKTSAVVESARPLDAETRRLLQDSLGRSVEERVLAELGAGVRVTTEAGQVDATAVSLARRAARAITTLENEAGAAAEEPHE
jgi:F0F1-type ATP synthase membrane subunit b/b'